jgi:subtilisin family serine protease
MNEKFGPALLERLHSAQDYDALDVAVFLPGEPAQEMLRAARPAVSLTDVIVDAAETIKQQSREEQRSLVGFLTENALAGAAAFIDGPVTVPAFQRIQPFWVNNSIQVTATRAALEQLASRSDVLHVELVRNASMQELMDARAVRTPRRKALDRPANAPVAVVTDAASVPTWSVERVNAPKLWELGIAGEGVLAAVIDTGVNYKHPDLVTRMWNGGASYPHHGYDFDANDDDPMDQEGHGTCCAGIVAGDGTSGKGTGVAPAANVMALRVGGQETTFWRAFEFAVEQRAHVISMSMSWKYPSSPNYPGWRRICETVLAANILHANSIGNQGSDLSTYPIPYNIATPGNCPPPRLHPLQAIAGGLASPLSCGATDDLDRLASFSGRGPAAWEKTPYVDYPYQGGSKAGLIKPDVCAPGPGTTSCNHLYSGNAGQPYVSFGGTSAATPHVGGCMVLLAQACLKAGLPIVPARVQEALENTAVRVAGQTKDKENHYGAGRIDVYAAYKYGAAQGWW